MVVVYLAGPISGLTKEEYSGWREDLKERFPDVKWLDPTDWPEDVEKDIQAIKNSDFIVFRIDHEKPSIGTSMELRIAFELEKSYVLWYDNAEVKDIRKWISYHVYNSGPDVSRVIVLDWDILIDWLQILIGEARGSRWIGKVR